jgi:O6-methylguanine-DNA--protein-cysteine methyltransferase
MFLCRGLDPYFSHCTKTNSKWIKALSARSTFSRRALENLRDIGMGNDFLNYTPIAQEIRAKTDK